MQQCSHLSLFSCLLGDSLRDYRSTVGEFLKANHQMSYVINSAPNGERLQLASLIVGDRI